MSMLILTARIAGGALLVLLALLLTAAGTSSTSNDAFRPKGLTFPQAAVYDRFVISEHQIRRMRDGG